MNTLKSEQIYCSAYSTLEHLRENIEQFIEQFYNRERLHSALDYVPPEEFERNAAARQSHDFALPVTLSFPRHEEIFPDA